MENIHSVFSLLTAITNALKHTYTDNALCTQYAWWMLEAILQQKKAVLLAQENIVLTCTQTQQLNTWIEQQCVDKIPLQYLIGNVPFGNCTILVEPPILIPRPETEQWCTELIEQLQKLSPKSLHILDMATGSGCIAIALAKALPHAIIYAVDISEKALHLAQRNAQHNDVTNITFILSDLFSHIPAGTYFDLIVANPPYISYGEWQNLDLSVRAWEDPAALTAPENGIGILKKIIEQAKQYIHPRTKEHVQLFPQLFLEIGYRQGKAVAELFHKENFSDILVAKDFHGNDRLVSGYLRNENKSCI